MDTKMKDWQTKGPDGKVYGLQPVSDWTDYLPDEGETSDYPEFTEEQTAAMDAAVGGSTKAADKTKAAKPADRKTE